MASANITIMPDLSPEAAPVPPMPKMPEPKLASPRMPHRAFPTFQVADGKATRNQVASAIPEPPLSRGPRAPHSRAEAAALRLRTSLTPELAQNFDLFIFVSKAERGPAAQRMYVFRRQEDGQLKLLYDWAASTGREREEISPRGRQERHRHAGRLLSVGSRPHVPPLSFLQLGPGHAPRHVLQLDREGVQTGLAIHSATGDDMAKLGSRASAGCVHLSPENAATLYRLVQGALSGGDAALCRQPRHRHHEQYRRADARAGRRLRMADGYRVLIDIENFGGADTVAALN